MKLFFGSSPNTVVQHVSLTLQGLCSVPLAKYSGVIGACLLRQIYGSGSLSVCAMLCKHNMKLFFGSSPNTVVQHVSLTLQGLCSVPLAKYSGLIGACLLRQIHGFGSLSICAMLCKHSMKLFFGSSPNASKPIFVNDTQSAKLGCFYINRAYSCNTSRSDTIKPSISI
jgi:hypothetical protein